MTIRGSGDGLIDAPVVYPFVTSTSRRAPLITFTADFDHDGRPDIGVVTESTCCTTLDTPSILIFMNRGTGVFEPLPEVRPSGATPDFFYNAFVFAHVGDFDGDGNMDIAIQQVRSASESINSVFFGVGDGTFLETRPPLPVGILIGAQDLFHEGAADLLFGNFGVLTIAGFTHERKLRPLVEWPLFSGVFADVNGDGLVDLYSPNYLLPNELLINEGRSLVRDSELRRLPVEATGSGIADVDADGARDLVSFPVSAENVVFLSIQQGLGDNTFAFPSYFGHPVELPPTSAGQIPSRSVLLDWDGDGRTDIVSQHSILFNRGGLQFERVGQLLNATLAASADFDGDGHRDAVAVTNVGLCVLLARPAAVGLEPSLVTIDQTPIRVVTPHVTSASGVPTGSVSFRENDRVLGSTEVGSRAVLPLVAGAHRITADYSGDEIFARSTTDFSLDVPRSRLQIGLQFGGNVASIPATLTATLGVGSEFFEPHGTVTFRDLSAGTVLAVTPASSITTVTLDLGAAPRSIRADYSGDVNYLPGSSSMYSYSPVSVPVSPRDSRLTVTATGRGFSIEVQLLGAGGQVLQIDQTNIPRINLSASRGVPDLPAYQGGGRYTSYLDVSRSPVELLTISALVTNEIIATATIGPIQRSRAAHK